MRKRVHLHGAFKAFADGPIEIEADTVWDAVEAVTLQLPGFKPDLNGYKRIQVAGFHSIESLKTPTKTVDIHVFPAMSFSKEGGVIETIIGATLIVASFFAAVTGNVGLANFLWYMGWSMIIGGVVQMLMPQPQMTLDNEQQERSKYLPSTQNTVRIGTPMGLLYGEYRVGGHLLSLNIDSKDVV